MTEVPDPARFSFELDPDGQIVRIVGVGDAQWPEWHALFDRVLAMPGFRPGTHLLIDWRQISSVPTRATVDAVVEYYASHAKQFGHCRVAAVTTSDVVFGINRMAEVFAQRTTVTMGVFREVSQAEAWLHGEAV